jgi:hypothetical protein
MGKWKRHIISDYISIKIVVQNHVRQKPMCRSSSVKFILILLPELSQISTFAHAVPPDDESLNRGLPANN